jgi:hypothetical protein
MDQRAASQIHLVFFDKIPAVPPLPKIHSPGRRLAKAKIGPHSG